MTLISSTTVASQALASQGTVDPSLKAIIDELNDDTGAVSAGRKAAIVDHISQRRIDLRSSSKATQEYFNAGVASSSFYQRGNALSAQLHAQMSARVDQNYRSSDTFKLHLDFFKNLSEEDKLAFATLKGQTPEDWQATIEARLKLASRIEAAQASGELGLDGQPTAKASAALSLLIEASDNFDKLDKTDKAALNSWTQRFNDQMSAADRSTAFRIDLTDDAKAFMARSVLSL